MGNVWQLQEAKNKFSKLVDKARHDGPPIVTKHGKESVIILPEIWTGQHGAW